MIFTAQSPDPDRELTSHDFRATSGPALWFYRGVEMNTDRDNDIDSAHRDERFCQCASRLSGLPHYSLQDRSFPHTQRDRYFPLSSALKFHRYSSELH